MRPYCALLLFIHHAAVQGWPVVKRHGLVRQQVRRFAKPNAKLPERSVKVMCQGCKTQLYLYKKGGKGSLVKCFKERIVADFTTEECICPSCKMTFARPTMIRGTPAFKMIGGKVFQK